MWKTLEMTLINCETNHMLTWSTDCVISAAIGATKFAITYTKLLCSGKIILTQQDTQDIWFRK